MTDQSSGEQRGWLATSRSVALLLLERSLGRWDGLESAIRDQLATLDRKSVCARGKPRLGALDGRELSTKIVGATRVEFILVEILRTPIARVCSIGRLERTVAV